MASGKIAPHAMPALAEQARLARIDGYWALCKASAKHAASLACAAAAILDDLFLLARQSCPILALGTVPELADATRRLLALEAVRDALVEPAPAPADPVDAFWEASQVVAIKLIEGEQVVVVRYDGPLFHPGTVPESEVRSEGYRYLVCHTENIGDGGEFEYLVAYAIGAVAEDGQWKDIQLDLASRSDLMRDIHAMEVLVERGGLSGVPFGARPLRDFPAPATP